MPIYNIKKEYLIEAVESLMKQTLKEIEIILINDASTDNSSLIIENFAQKDQRITIIHKEKNEMTGKARNSGLDFATGNYLGFLDYDDIANKETFSVAYKEAIEGNFTVVTSTTSNDQGHVTGIETTKFTLPTIAAPGDGVLTVTAQTGSTNTGSERLFSANQPTNTNSTLNVKGNNVINAAVSEKAGAVEVEIGHNELTAAQKTAVAPVDPSTLSNTYINNGENLPSG
jgi:glycosyltransferase involved in cell wall biosynthesis